MKTYNMIMLIDDRNLVSYIGQRIFIDSGIADDVVVEPTGNSALEYLRLNQNIDENIPEMIIIETGVQSWDTFEFLKQFYLLPQKVRQKCEVTVFSNGNLMQSFDQMKTQEAMKNTSGRHLGMDDLAAMELEMN